MTNEKSDKAIPCRDVLRRETNGSERLVMAWGTYERFFGG